jgi:hypothetical protein
VQASCCANQWASSATSPHCSSTPSNLSCTRLLSHASHLLPYRRHRSSRQSLIQSLLLFPRSFPVRPLLDPLTSSLTPSLIRALTRIFKLSDTDGNGRLSDVELCAYQQRAYGSNLLPQECVGLMEVLLDAGSGSADANGVSLEGFFYLHKMMVQGGRQESVWATLSAHGYAQPPSLRLTPSSIPQICEADHARLLCTVAHAETWGAMQTAWRVNGGHRAALTSRAVQFIASFLSGDHTSHAANALQHDARTDQTDVSPAAISALLEVPPNSIINSVCFLVLIQPLSQAAAASPSSPRNEIIASSGANCSTACVLAAWSAAAALNPQDVVAALCQAGACAPY